MVIAAFPRTVYTSSRHFNAYTADDMQYGDLTESMLKKQFQLVDISNVIDPYTMIRKTAFNTPQSRFAGVYGDTARSNTMTARECARLLFDEMQTTSLPYTCIGPYRHIFQRMLTHFQHSGGLPFNDFQLNAAYTQQILKDNSNNSTRMAIQQELNDHINYAERGYPQERLPELKKIINSRILPKFDSVLLDKINGLAISVHDVYATRIDIVELEVGHNDWRAQVKYYAQDHFGLDKEDIRKQKFNQFQFFKIWFILQRFDRFGFRPFFTNMEATIEMRGGCS